MPRFLPLARRLATLAAPLAFSVSLLPAQAAWSLPGEFQQAQAEQGFSQEMLKSYAAAVLEVQRVDSAWQPRLQEAETAEEREAMTRQATDEMVGEIQAQGLSVQQYNDITKAAEQDERLYDRIMTLLAEAQ